MHNGSYSLNDLLDFNWILYKSCYGGNLCDSDKTVPSTLNIRPFLKTVQVLLFIVSFFKLL